MSYIRSIGIVCCVVGIGLLSLPSVYASSEPLPADAPVVLHVGDSFVHVGFAQTLRPKFRSAGARYVVKAKHSIYTPTIIQNLGLPLLMLQQKPALVILTIGANEMAMIRPSNHAHAIRKVSEVVSQGASCVWVTPPPPARGQTGIVEEILRESAPCRVFDSTPIAPSLQRERDNIHPTRAAGARWADAFWHWLQDELEPQGAPWTLKVRPSEPTQVP